MKSSVTPNCKEFKDAHHIRAAVIGASIGSIGTAVGQQSIRAVLSFCNAR